MPLPARVHKVNGVSYDARKKRWVARPYLPTGRTFLGHFLFRYEAEAAVMGARAYYDTSDSMLVSLEDKYLQDYDSGELKRENPHIEDAMATIDVSVEDQLALEAVMNLLTDSQRQIADLLVEGYLPAEIAAKLETTLETVSTDMNVMKITLEAKGYAPKEAQ